MIETMSALAAASIGSGGALAISRRQTVALGIVCGGFGIAGGNPINGSSFILDNSDRAFHLYNKLIEPLRFESLF